MPEQTVFVFAELHRSEWDSHVELLALYKVIKCIFWANILKVWFKWDVVWLFFAYATLKEMTILDLTPGGVDAISRKRKVLFISHYTDFNILFLLLLACLFLFVFTTTVDMQRLFYLLFVSNFNRNVNNLYTKTNWNTRLYF